MSKGAKTCVRKELRVVLLGKTGVGKSSTGNTLLDREAFRVSRGLTSGTERCQWADEYMDDIVLQVTDTPGLCDTHRDERDVLLEVGKSVAVARPGPHIILMVLRGDRRFTQEEFQAYNTLKALFGTDITKYMIVVFVGADTYGTTLKEQRKGLNKEMQKASGDMAAILQDTEGRYVGINNKASKDDRRVQSKELIDMMKALKHSNGDKYFSDSPLSHEVNKLVEPLVQSKLQDGTSKTLEEANRDTNLAIVEGKVNPGFFPKLLDVVTEKVLPLLHKTLDTIQAAAGAVTAISAASKNCSVM